MSTGGRAVSEAARLVGELTTLLYEPCLGTCLTHGPDCLIVACGACRRKADKPESGCDLFDAFDGLLWRRPMRRRNASQGRVNLGKAVCGTTRGAWFAIRKKAMLAA